MEKITLTFMGEKSHSENIIKEIEATVGPEFQKSFLSFVIPFTLTPSFEPKLAQ